MPIRLDDVYGFGDDVDAAFLEWRAAIERANNLSVHGHAELDNTGPKGAALFVKRPPGARVARTGGTAIPAMSGSTPGSGTVTLYDLSSTILTVTAATVTAYNIAPATVTANTWIMVLQVDGKWVVFYEICAV